MKQAKRGSHRRDEKRGVRTSGGRERGEEKTRGVARCRVCHRRDSFSFGRQKYPRKSAGEKGVRRENEGIREDAVARDRGEERAIKFIPVSFRRAKPRTFPFASEIGTSVRKQRFKSTARARARGQLPRNSFRSRNSRQNFRRYAATIWRARAQTYTSDVTRFVASYYKQR